MRVAPEAQVIERSRCTCPSDIILHNSPYERHVNIPNTLTQNIHITDRIQNINLPPLRTPFPNLAPQTNQPLSPASTTKKQTPYLPSPILTQPTKFPSHLNAPSLMKFVTSSSTQFPIIHPFAYPKAIPNKDKVKSRVLSCGPNYSSS